MWNSSVPYSLPQSSLIQCGHFLSYQFCNATAAPVLYHRSPFRRHYASKTGADDNGKKSSVKTSPSSATAPRKTSKVEFQQNIKPTPKPASQPGDKDYVLPSLSRPIGLIIPPEEGQNTGIDPRSLRQRRDDFVDYGRHLERRKELYATLRLLQLD